MGGTEEQRNARTCVFCGAPANSRQHLLPDWLRKVLPSDEKATHYRQVGKDPSGRHEWNRRPFRQKSWIVCKPCNMGWMADLEKASRPVLEDAIQHQPGRLGPDAQRIAATWAFQTCLVFQASETEKPLAPGAHFAHIREKGTPPPQAAIWIGSHARVRDDPISSVFVQRPLALQERDSEKVRRGIGYLCFLAVGGISFVVVAHRLKNHVKITYEGGFDEALIQIWPDPSGLLLWPPPLMMDREFIEIITLPPGGFFLRGEDTGA